MAGDAPKAARRTTAKKSKPKSKQVLEAPFAREFPAVEASALAEVVAAVEGVCAQGLWSGAPKTAWGKLKHLPKEKRREAREQERRSWLKGLGETEAKVERERTERRRHLVLGYNCIVRTLAKDGLAAVLVNVNAETDFLANSLVGACEGKGVLLVPVECLDGFYAKTVAVGLRNSVKDAGNCLHPLFSAMKRCAPTVSTAALVDEPLGSLLSKKAAAIAKKKEKKKVPSFEVSKLHLNKISDDILAFTPGCVRPTVTPKPDGFGSDFLGVSSLSKHEVYDKLSFDYRTKPTKMRKLESEPQTKTLVEDFPVDSDISKNLADFTFTIDTEKTDVNVTDSDSKQEDLPGDTGAKSLKRKKSYKQAKLLRLIGNPNKKKKSK